MWQNCIHLEYYQKQRKVCKHNQVFPLLCIVGLMDHTRFYQKSLFHKCFKATNAWWWHSHKIQLFKIFHQGDRFSDALYQQHWFPNWALSKSRSVLKPWLSWEIWAVFGLGNRTSGSSVRSAATVTRHCLHKIKLKLIQTGFMRNQIWLWWVRDIGILPTLNHLL